MCIAVSIVPPEVFFFTFSDYFAVHLYSFSRSQLRLNCIGRGSAVAEKRSASRRHKSLLNGGRSCWRTMPAPSRDDSIRGTVRERFLNVR